MTLVMRASEIASRLREIARYLELEADRFRAAAYARAATAVETTHVAYSRAAVTDVPMTLGVACAIALALAGRFEWAAVAAGLAAAANYLGALALVPVAVLAWGRWRRLAVSAALERLEPGERELIALKFFAGLDNREIAGVLGIGESNAGTRLHRAMTKLREACDGNA